MRSEARWRRLWKERCSLELFRRWEKGQGSVFQSSMNYEALAKKARYFKQDEKGVAAMCKIMGDMRNVSGNIQTDPTGRLKPCLQKRGNTV